MLLAGGCYRYTGAFYGYASLEVALATRNTVRSTCDTRDTLCQRRTAQVGCLAVDHVARRITRSPPADRHKERLRSRPMRCVYRFDRGKAGQLLSDARGYERWRQGHDH